MVVKYLAFDGIDGCGKHEQIKLFSAALAKTGVATIHLLEPSYGPYGREIRRRLRESDLGSLIEQRDLFTLDRRHHVETKIKPLLGFVRDCSGFVILQSRTYLSAAAYQGESEHLDHLAAIVEEQRAFAPDPDLIIILDLSVEQALERLDRAGRRDALEREEILAKARSRYVRIAESLAHCVVIDACGSPGEVAERVQAAIRQREEERGKL